MLIVALVHSRLDYCNAMLVALPAYLQRRLQSALYAAARLIYRLGFLDLIIDLFVISTRCEFQSLSCTLEPLIRVADVSSRQAVCSAGTDRLVVPTIKLLTLRLLYHVSGTVRLTTLSTRVLTGAQRRDHILPILKQLHWLPVQRRVECKLAVLVFKSLRGPNPAVPGGGIPADCQRPWALSSSCCQCQHLHRSEDQYSIGRQKLQCRWTRSLEQSTQHSATA